MRLVPVSETVAQAEALGIQLRLDAGKLKARLPAPNARVSDIVEQLRARRGEVIELLRRRPRLPGIAAMPMPRGVKLIGWNLKDPPIAIDLCSVVIDPASFVDRTLNQLQAALTGKNWLAGNRTVRELVERLEQVGVEVVVMG